MLSGRRDVLRKQPGRIFILLAELCHFPESLHVAKTYQQTALSSHLTYGLFRFKRDWFGESETWSLELEEPFYVAQLRWEGCAHSLKLTTDQRLHKEMYFLPVPEAGSLTSQCWQLSSP